MEKHIKIYQLPKESNYKFRGFEYAATHGLSLADYRCVWDTTKITELEGEDLLDALYVILNVRLPETGYTGHSLSVSDVVEVDGEYYYVDDVGFVHWLVA